MLYALPTTFKWRTAQTRWLYVRGDYANDIAALKANVDEHDVGLERQGKTIDECEPYIAIHGSRLDNSEATDIEHDTRLDIYIHCRASAWDLGDVRG